MLFRLRGLFFYKIVAKPSMLYGAEYWAMEKCADAKVYVAEMQKLKRMCGVTRKDLITTEYVK